MSFTVFLAVIGAAALHAIWNAIVKGGSDKLVSMAAVMLGHVPLAVICLFFAPDPDPASYPYIIASIALHFGYQLFLMKSYRIGDLTQVYPVARGSAPLIVALVSVAFLGVHLSPMELVSVAVIGVGILSLASVRSADGMQNQQAGILALITGGFIAAYSLVDGIGARIAGTSLGFYSWVAIGNGAIVIAYLLATSPVSLLNVARHSKRVFVIGGGASFIAYAIVTWAFTQAPIALVTALRETSIVFAILIGVFVMKERLDLARLASTMTVLMGVVVLRLSGR